MSAKNELQEYCQQKKIKMPVYKSKSFGAAHEPQWLAKVNVEGLNVKTVVAMGSKTSAEQMAAQLCLDRLKCVVDAPIGIVSSIVLIDLENRPSFRQALWKDVIYIGFNSMTHNSLHKYDKWHRCYSDDIENELLKSNMLLYLIEGGVADLVDHFMTAFVFPLASYVRENENIKMVYIVSGDHAGFCTKACLEKVLAWRGIEEVRVRCVGSVEDVY